MKKLISCALAALLLCSLVPGAWAVTESDVPADTELYLYVGSPIALSGGKILPLDAQNPDLVPVLHKSRTLVPLRFVSEFFGAKVDYDAEKHAGLVTIGDKSAVFPVGESSFTLNGETIAIDTETLEIDGRIFLPLRAVGEQLFALHVDYKDGVILLSKEQGPITDAAAADVKAQIGSFVKVATLEELKANVQSGMRYLTDYDDVPVAALEEGAEAAVPAPEAPTAEPTESQSVADDSGGGGGDYSTTNVQTEGVDESDIIKTDGKYIYLLGGSVLKIVRVEGDMSQTASLRLDDNYHASEMYVDGDRLVLIGSRYEYGDTPIMYGREMALDMMYPYFSSSFTFVMVYDISDKSDLQLLRSFEIEGHTSATRKMGDYLYLATTLSVWSHDGEDPRPLMGENGRIAPMPIDDIMIMPGYPAEQMLTISAINIRDGEEEVESETIAGSGGTTYMSTNAMYLAGYSYQDDESFLSIAKFSLDENRVGYAGSGRVDGYLNDQFSMDESKGHLRVVTTVWNNETSNNLYVLDGNMRVCGSVLGFAPDESIYSARFMGDRGYVVTFRQMDPLFVFDLSDPTNPQITGELKVPGFSSYLHPVSQDVILGVGNDVYDIYAKDKNGREVVIGQRTGGIKLSLFDVSDMGQPREIDTLILGDSSGYAELLYNHKAAMFKSSEALLGFTASLDGFDEGEDWSGALFISYSGNRLRELGRIDSERDKYDVVYEDEDYFYFGERLVYIGDTVYYAEGNQLRSFDLDTLRELQTLKLR